LEDGLLDGLKGTYRGGGGVKVIACIAGVDQDRSPGGEGAEGDRGAGGVGEAEPLSHGVRGGGDVLGLEGVHSDHPLRDLEVVPCRGISARGNLSGPRPRVIASTRPHCKPLAVE